MLPHVFVTNFTNLIAKFVIVEITRDMDLMPRSVVPLAMFSHQVRPVALVPNFATK